MKFASFIHNGLRAAFYDDYDKGTDLFAARCFAHTAPALGLTQEEKEIFGNVQPEQLNEFHASLFAALNL